MKRTIITALLCLAVSLQAAAALSTSAIRNEARLLADRMAYELGLTNGQYEDCYEINFDFIYAVNPIMSSVVKQRSWAVSEYYRFLDLRNDDLRYVLSYSQYERFLMLEYFFRPIYVRYSNWYFHIHDRYPDYTRYYRPEPACFRHYSGAHSRSRHHDGYYGHKYAGPGHERRYDRPVHAKDFRPEPPHRINGPKDPGHHDPHQPEPPHRINGPKDPGHHAPQPGNPQRINGPKDPGHNGNYDHGQKGGGSQAPQQPSKPGNGNVKPGSGNGSGSAKPGSGSQPKSRNDAHKTKPASSPRQAPARNAQPSHRGK